MSLMSDLAAWQERTDALLAHNATVVAEAERNLSGSGLMGALHEARAEITSRRKTSPVP